MYDTHDGDGTCITAICGKNGNIIRNIEICATTTPTTPFNFTSGKNERSHHASEISCSLCEC